MNSTVVQWKNVTLEVILVKCQGHVEQCVCFGKFIFILYCWGLSVIGTSFDEAFLPPGSFLHILNDQIRA